MKNIVLPLFLLTSNALGDRVAICSRNYPEYLVAFWASRKYTFPHTCHCGYVLTNLAELIGAISTLVNA